MRVALISRSTLFTAKGGDTVQIEQTARHLRRLGIGVDVKRSDEKIDYPSYDLLHFFNITRPADILIHAKNSKLPYALSTIFVDYSEYDKGQRKGLAGFVFNALGTNGIEYVKTVARWILGKDKLPTISYLWKGHGRAVNEVLHHAAILLPNSESEYHRLEKKYPLRTPYLVVPNGIDASLFHFNPHVAKDPLLVICVARIEGIKNQFNLIKALNGSRYKLLLIGAAAPNQAEYYKACRNIAHANVEFIDHLPQQELVAYYQRAKVHVLPSWFETTGLSSLEAAAMGCNIVITDKGDTREYFEGHACYCDPASPQTILNAVIEAAAAGLDRALQKKIIEDYSWEKATIKTCEAYERIK